MVDTTLGERRKLMSFQAVFVLDCLFYDDGIMNVFG